jgi:hypothetical protein
VNPPASLWLGAFAITLTLEVPIFTVFLFRRLGVVRAFMLGVGVNTITHPFLWYVMPRFEPYATWLVASEVLVFAAETFIVAWVLHSRLRDPDAIGLAALTSLTANAASTVAGILIFR